MTSNYHISKSQKPARCDAKPGNCPLGGEHYATKQEADQVIKVNAIRDLLAPKSAPVPVLNENVRDHLFNLIDINDDEEALEDMGHDADVRAEAWGFVYSTEAELDNPSAVFNFLEDIADVDYDEDELEVDEDTKTETKAWIAKTRSHFEAQDKEQTGA